MALLKTMSQNRTTTRTNSGNGHETGNGGYSQGSLCLTEL